MKMNLLKIAQTGNYNLLKEKVTVFFENGKKKNVPLEKQKKHVDGDICTVTKVTTVEVKDCEKGTLDTFVELPDFVQETDESSPSDIHSSLTNLFSGKWKDITKKIKEYEEKTKFRKRLVSKWESLNYDTIENEFHWQKKRKPNVKKHIMLKFIHRWVIAFFIGLFTAILAAVLHLAVEKITHAKYGLIQGFLDRCSNEGCLYQPALIWIAINISVTCLGSAIVVYLQPVSAGGGVPLIKAYLNGVQVPSLLTVECFFAKILGVMMTIVGGLAGDKEGPMSHAGSIIGAALSKGRIRLCKQKVVSLYHEFRDDSDTRDFVSGGAASGVAAGFGAPIGGTLFSVEEAASFWSQSLTWRVFFSAMVASFFTNFLLGSFHGTPTKLSDPGLVRLDVFPNVQFDLLEIPLFLIMGVVGGLVGAMFVTLNYKLSVLRKKFIKMNWLKISEAGFVAGLTALVSFLMMMNINDCTDKEVYDTEAIISQMHCPANKRHSFSTLFLATPEGCLKALIHEKYGFISSWPLAIFAVVYFLFSVCTSGLTVSSGVFVPALIIGASWGRLIGKGVVAIFPAKHEFYEYEVGKYALLGAAAQLGGIFRTTISLTVILVECTGNISFGLPLMIVLMISKWVGDFMSTGLYDMNVEVLGIPMLSWEPPELCDDVMARDLMHSPVLTLNKIEKVGVVVHILRNTTFCGFPIIDEDDEACCKSTPVVGLILRVQLLVLLKHKVFAPASILQPQNVRLKDFRKYEVQHLNIQDIAISEVEMDCFMDLRPFLNPSPYTVQPTFSLPKLFKLFRGLGLRHLIVTNDHHEPVGMITRKDLAKFREESAKGLIKVQHLVVEEE